MSVQLTCRCGGRAGTMPRIKGRYVLVEMADRMPRRPNWLWAHCSRCRRWAVFKIVVDSDTKAKPEAA